MPESTIPNAWDDDWETIADKQDHSQTVHGKGPEVKVSKAERKAKHAELNKQIWESAENSEKLLFVQARDDAPILEKAAFKPNVTVLSRKPPQLLSRNDPTSSMAGLTLEEEDDSEEERRKKNEASLAERTARAQREREEKERRYAEVRERLFGSAPQSEESLSRSSTPNRQARGKGKVRGGRDTSQPTSSADQSPARGASARRQLYDPGYSVKPNPVFVQKKESGGSRPITPNEHQPIREPRGPQVTGRGGFGFAARGRGAGPAA